MPTNDQPGTAKPGRELFRSRAEELRRLANRHDSSSLRNALLVAAREWDELAERVAREQGQ